MIFRPFSSLGFFRFAPSPARRRPADWLFGSDDRVPGAALWLLAAQHAATAMAFITYVLATAQIAGLDRQGTQSMVAMTLLGMALCTGLQAWGGRVGSGLLLVHMPNPFVITVVAALVVAHGPGGVAVATLVYGITALLWGRWCSGCGRFFRRRWLVRWCALAGWGWWSRPCAIRWGWMRSGTSTPSAW